MKSLELVREDPVKVVTSSADPGPTHSERARNLAVLNRAELMQGSGIHGRIIQDLFQA